MWLYPCYVVLHRHQVPHAFVRFLCSEDADSDSNNGEADDKKDASPSPPRHKKLSPSKLNLDSIQQQPLSVMPSSLVRAWFPLGLFSATCGRGQALFPTPSRVCRHVLV